MRLIYNATRNTEHKYKYVNIQLRQKHDELKYCSCLI